MYDSVRTKRVYNKFMFSLAARSMDNPDEMMNYGYAKLDSEKGLFLEEKAFIYEVQLYHFISTGLGTLQNLQDKIVLEVSCGLGGGSQYVAQQLFPMEMHAIDYVEKNIEICQSKFEHVSNLKFSIGDAEALPFTNGVFDIIINIQSSCFYGEWRNFIQECERVLKPGGALFWAEKVKPRDKEALLETVQTCGLEVVEVQDITRNIVKALGLTSQRKINSIEQKAPRLLKNEIKNMQGVEGYEIYNAFEQGLLVYLAGRFIKPK